MIRKSHKNIRVTANQLKLQIAVFSRDYFFTYLSRKLTLKA